MTTLFKFFTSVFPIFFIIIFGFVLFVFISTFSKMIKENKYNAAAPQLTVNAKVAAKRTEVSGSEFTRTKYFATFEFDSGDRTELKLSGEEYGMLSENDLGSLTFKGNQFISFNR